MIQAPCQHTWEGAEGRDWLDGQDGRTFPLMAERPRPVTWLPGNATLGFRALPRLEVCPALCVCRERAQILCE